MPKPRLLYTAFDPIPSPKGASTHTLQFLKCLELDFDTKLLCLGAPGLQERGQVQGIPVRRVPGPGGNLVARAVVFAEQAIILVEQDRFAAVHFRSPWDGYPLAWYRSRHQPNLRLLYEVNGLPSIELPYHHPDLPSPLLKKIRSQEEFALQEADAIICPSEVTRRYLIQRGASGEKITVIPNGVDLIAFRPGPEPDGALPTITYVGTLSPWQGLGDLLRACAILKHPFRLRIIGGGPRRLRRELVLLAHRLRLTDRLVLEEPLSPAQIPEVIRGASVCVAPLDASDRNTLQGCCPLKILEYLACGRPVVAADLPAVRDLVQADEEALLYPPGDHHELARKLEQALSHPEQARELGRRGRLRAERDFTWEQAGRRLLGVYREMGLLNSEADPLQSDAYICP